MANKANAAPLPIDQGPQALQALVGDIAKELEGVGAKWFEIGVLLGVPVNTLEQLSQGPNAGNFNLYLQMILMEWLNAYASTPGRRTWQILADAVENPGGGYNRLLAGRIVQLSKNARYPQSTVAPEPPPAQVAPPNQQARYTPSTVVLGPPPAQVAPPTQQGQPPTLQYGGGYQPAASGYQQPGYYGPKSVQPLLQGEHQAVGDLLDRDLSGDNKNGRSMVSMTPPEDLPYVIKAVFMLSTRWQNIHSCLMITRTRNGILMVHPHIPMRCLITVLNEWLNFGYNMDRNPDPSWKEVVSFVKEGNSGNNAIQAAYIERNIQAISAFNPGVMAKKANAAPLPNDQGPEALQALVGDIAKELEGVGAKWFEIGVLLGVPVNTLEQFSRSLNAGDFNLCLQMIVREWLMAYDSTPGRRTWQILADAVENPGGGYNRLLAGRIVQLSKNARYPQSTVVLEPPPAQVAPPTQQARNTLFDSILD